MNFYDALKDTRIMYGFSHGFERSGSSDGEVFETFDDAAKAFDAYGLADDRAEEKSIAVLLAWKDGEIITELDTIKGARNW